MGQMNGKVAVVTGASRGIGRDMALVFAREGARVVVSARTEEEGESPISDQYSDHARTHSRGRRRGHRSGL